MAHFFDGYFDGKEWRSYPEDGIGLAKRRCPFIASHTLIGKKSDAVEVEENEGAEGSLGRKLSFCLSPPMPLLRVKRKSSFCLSNRRCPMPVVTIRIAKGRTIDMKRAVSDAVTKALVNTLDVRPEWVTILIEEYDRENWATGGQLHADMFGPGYGKASVDE